MEIIKGKYIRYYDVSPEEGLNDDQIQERIIHRAINKEKHSTKIKVSLLGIPVINIERK